MKKILFIFSLLTLLCYTLCTQELLAIQMNTLAKGEEIKKPG